jgi:hypothetical protein
MRRQRAIVAGVALLSTVVVVRAQSVSAGKPNFSGHWILNRDQSDKPPQPQSDANPNVSLQFGEERGRGSGDRDQRYGPATNRDRHSVINELVRQFKSPSPSLTISHADPILTVTNAHDHTHLFQTNGRRDPHQVGDATVVSTSRWYGDRLVTDYDLGGGATLRIAFSLVPATNQLVQQLTFANGQTTRRVYDRAGSVRRR